MKESNTRKERRSKLNYENLNGEQLNHSTAQDPSLYVDNVQLIKKFQSFYGTQ
jgi:hypothetical protein